MKKKRRRQTLSRENNSAKETTVGRHRADTGPDSGGQSGDMQRLSRVAQSSGETVVELASAG